MCSTCEALGALLLAENAETELLASDIEDRLAPARAVRPLFEHERRAQTRFADLDEMQDRAVQEADELLASLHLLVGGVLMGSLFGQGQDKRTPAEVMAGLEALLAEQPAELRNAVAATTARLQEVYARVYNEASGQVLAEAMRQGVTPGIAPRTVDPEVFQAQARAVAAHPWRRITGKVMDSLGTPAVLMGDTLEAETLQDVLDGIATDGSTDLARQGIHTATGLGRIETADELEPLEIWASEILDGATCTPCSHVDGKDYETLDEARAEYPMGGYKSCQGGMGRCRGSLVFIFEDSTNQPGQ